jgi:enoyl-CoA hydratase
MLAAVMDIARTIARRSPLAIRGTKEVLLYGRDHSVAEGLRYIANWNAGMLSADDLMRSVMAGGRTDDLSYGD